MNSSDLLDLATKMENETKQIKDDCMRLVWYMRGGVSLTDMMWRLSFEDRQIMNRIVKDNIETTNKTKLPLL